MPDHPTPAPRRVPRWERINFDLIEIVAARRLTADDLPRTVDDVGIADPVPLVADSEPGDTAC
jgi:hypothetical protein